MEMDVNLSKSCAVQLMTISAGSYRNNNNINQSVLRARRSSPSTLTPSLPNTVTTTKTTAKTTSTKNTTPPASPKPRAGCCGILSRLLCVNGSTGKTANSSTDYTNFCAFTTTTTTTTKTNNGTIQQPPPAYAYLNLNQRKSQNRRTPQEIYLESRGKSCKKLLKFNGNSNKILLYPEEGWARTASSSYWTITPCWWQPNRCHIEEFAGTQRHTTKAKMVQLEQKGSLLIAGNFRTKRSNSNNGRLYNSTSNSNNYNNNNYNNNNNSNNNNNNNGNSSSNGTNSSRSRSSDRSRDKDTDEFKLYLSSNISMEDYNMGYCLTGFVERRCQQTNTFQMTHFAVIKRQWPSISSNAKST